MAELTHDTTDDGFHEIQLSGKQLVFLVMATTVVSVVIFLCGVMVGRGVRAERGEEPIDSPIAAVAPAVTEEAAPPSSAEPPAPPAEDELSYHKRLQGGGEPEPPPPAAAEAPQPAPPVAAATPKPEEPAADVPTSGRPGTWVIQVHALKDRAGAAALVKRLVGKGYPAFLQNPAPGTPVIYRVRIGRYGDRSEADQVVRRLQKEEQFTPVVTR